MDPWRFRAVNCMSRAIKAAWRLSTPVPAGGSGSVTCRRYRVSVWASAMSTLPTTMAPSVRFYAMGRACVGRTTVESKGARADMIARGNRLFVYTNDGALKAYDVEARN